MESGHGSCETNMLERKPSDACKCEVPGGFFVCTVCLKGIDLRRHVMAVSKGHSAFHSKYKRISEGGTPEVEVEGEG
jgi:hypothetical protein